MNFKKVLSDITKLQNIKLHSIRPGSEITIEQVTDSRITVISKTGKRQTRPISEFKTIWQKLNENTAVHVDEALHGSGTSRNQPETIFANLPYIEWLKYENKKHITFVGKNSHNIGTIKKMDEIAAENIRIKLKGEVFRRLELVIITDNLVKIARVYESIMGVNPEALDKDTYIFRHSQKSVIVISKTAINSDVDLGTYYVTNQSVEYKIKKQIRINGISFGVLTMNGLKLLMEIN